MKVLLLCYQYPSPSLAGTHRVLYSLRYLFEKYRHDITLVTFRLPETEYTNLGNHYRIEAVDIPSRPGIGSLKAVESALRNMLSPYNLLSRHFSLNIWYSRKMNSKVKTLLQSGFDLVAVDHPAMLCYISKTRIPVVLLEAIDIIEIARMEYKLETNRFRKFIRFLYYYHAKELVKKYSTAKKIIAVSNSQRDSLKAHLPHSDIVVIPHGIDMGDNRLTEPEDEHPNLVISGSMSGVGNRRAVLRFCNEIYPLIKAEIPDVRLYIVGRDPSIEIQQLAADESIIVTGYVNDLRPYISRAWVIVAPLLEGHGVKIRVLQAMAMGKPVVASSMVSQGIDVSQEEDIIIADEPVEFARRVIELLNDRQARERIGANAKLLMETKHNWQNLADRLNEVLEKAAEMTFRYSDKA